MKADQDNDDIDVQHFSRIIFLFGTVLNTPTKQPPIPPKPSPHDTRDERRSEVASRERERGNGEGMK